MESNTLDKDVSCSCKRNVSHTCGAFRGKDSSFSDLKFLFPVADAIKMTIDVDQLRLGTSKWERCQNR